MIGASLLWVGWFGFNAGSEWAADGLAAAAMMNTQVAAAGAALTWMIIEWVERKKPGMLGLASGAIAGLVAVTPAAGFVNPQGALIIGIVSNLFNLLGVEPEWQQVAKGAIILIAVGLQAANDHARLAWSLGGVRKTADGGRA